MEKEARQEVTDEEISELERLYQSCCWNAETFDIAAMPARQAYLVKARDAVPKLIAALREARAKPESIKRRDGMVCNLMGLLRNGARREAGYQFALEELGKNLKELRDRYLAGDTEVVREFFSLYVIED